MINPEKIDELLKEFENSIKKLQSISEMQKKTDSTIKCITDKEMEFIEEFEKIRNDFQLLLAENDRQLKSMSSDVDRRIKGIKATLDKETKNLDKRVNDDIKLIKEEITNNRIEIGESIKDEHKQVLDLANNVKEENEKIMDIIDKETADRNNFQTIIDGKVKNAIDSTQKTKKNSETNQNMKIDSMNDSLEKKIKIAYLVAGIGLLLGIIGIIV